MQKINYIHRFVSVMIVLTMILSGFVPNSVSAQGGDGLKRQVNAQTGKVSFIGPESGRALPASKALGTFIRPQDPARALIDSFSSLETIRDVRELAGRFA